MNEKKQHKNTEEYKAENAAEVDTAVSGGSDVTSGECGDASGAADVEMAANDELDAVKKELEDKSKKCEEYLDKLQRTAAEFDNFKKRSVKEKEALYAEAVSDVICSFLPVIDNVERALQAISEDSSAQSLKDGVEMVFKQFGDALKNLGVEEIKALNETFDPMWHNAVMHVEDDSLGHSVVIEEFQKGYKYKDKVIRYSMVKVAN
ncbi:MAG: nucleotide exchange factor GrpE [Clostridiaceae bacterium]|nr:nucleotide exchange factor GrpE [Clostridiaceae bacterium]